MKELPLDENCTINEEREGRAFSDMAEKYRQLSRMLEDIAANLMRQRDMLKLECIKKPQAETKRIMLELFKHRDSQIYYKEFGRLAHYVNFDNKE